MRMSECEARKAGEALAATLQEEFGVEWQVRVWENFGWHVSVDYGYMKVRRCINKYHVYLGEHGGNALWHDAKFYATPAEAVRAQIAKAEEAVSRLRDMIPLELV